MSFLKELFKEFMEDITSGDSSESHPISPELKEYSKDVEIRKLKRDIKLLNAQLEAVNIALESFNSIANQVVEMAKLIDENRQLIIQLYELEENTDQLGDSEHDDPFLLPNIHGSDDKNNLN